MRRFYLPPLALRAWARLNDVQSNGITFNHILSDERGLGVSVITEPLRDETVLLKVPESLVLSLENVWIYAKSDPHLKEVLDAVGEYAQTARGAILIFLLMQITHGSCEEFENIGVSNPFTEYIKFLPPRISLPTFWSEDERALLAGTSLEAALNSKLKSLDREFTHLRDSTASIEWCRSYWWNDGPQYLHFDDWKQVDAMYRSRALDLPGTGHAMVPCIDMANHAAGDDTVALYDTDADGNAVLVLRTGKGLKVGDEVTITYGDEKGACEMIFSYGFIEDSMTSARELFLDLDIPDDDPLRLAKKAVSKSAPGFKIFAKDDATDWEGNFVWLGCVNEEDGLDFRLLQTTDGEKELKVFWRDGAVSDISELRNVLEQERQWDVFQLRAIATLQSRVERQLLALDRSKASLSTTMPKVDKTDSSFKTAMKLRDLEEKLMLQAYEHFEAKTTISRSSNEDFDEVHDECSGRSTRLPSLMRNNNGSVPHPMVISDVTVAHMNHQTASSALNIKRGIDHVNPLKPDNTPIILCTTGSVVTIYTGLGPRVVKTANQQQQDAGLGCILGRLAASDVRRMPFYVRLYPTSQANDVGLNFFPSSLHSILSSQRLLIRLAAEPSQITSRAAGCPVIMPGILPMKVIKLGTSAQSRIAQACDRCRSKKIRCDGVTPCCTQCANVGFECKTSDKLSRRAFPRGYTESLEERVRALEQDVRELKDLLDEKDEKIDILSRIHSRSPATTTASGERSPSTVEHEAPQQDTFRLQQSPSLLDGETDSYFMGPSSGRAFIDVFKTKVQESGKPCSSFETNTFFAASKSPTPSSKASSPKVAVTQAPPRLVSDQMINIFFQEWAPLFPILHRPTFLQLYTEYVADPDHMADQHAVAQLNLWNKQNVESFEWQWRDAIEAVLTENTLATLQCLVLAQLYCIAKADYNKLLHYKGMAISLSHRLGLHQTQKRFSLGALTSETRKRVFWTLYTLDCFSAALLGLPTLLNEDDIHTEYPVDIDDENVSERGFQSTLPGESTRLSSALALFRGSRILAKVLDEMYPASVSYELSLQRMSALNDELDAWQGSLPPHLRLQFIQDKPSANVVGSRSPFLVGSLRTS
ncbi:MAG: hypothetical protein Q9211_006794 [Gyalolechia sp. 1 TL-2023]